MGKGEEQRRITLRKDWKNDCYLNERRQKKNYPEPGKDTLRSMETSDCVAYLKEHSICHEDGKR